MRTRWRDDDRMGRISFTEQNAIGTRGVGGGGGVTSWWHYVWYNIGIGFSIYLSDHPDTSTHPHLRSAGRDVRWEINAKKKRYLYNIIAIDCASKRLRKHRTDGIG